MRPALLTRPARTLELRENTTVVVLGASGDLAKKKTVCFPLRSRLQAKPPPHTQLI